MDSPPKNPARTDRKKTILRLIFFAVPTLLLVASIVGETTFKLSHSSTPKPQKGPNSTTVIQSHGRDHEINNNAIIKIACTSTLYPSFCLSALSSSPLFTSKTQNASPLTFNDILHIGINETLKYTEATQSSIRTLIKDPAIRFKEKNALKDCLDLMDQTLYELHQAIHDLHSRNPTPFSNLKTLLSAAMTNEHTCITGFSDLEQRAKILIADYQSLEDYLLGMLTPISQMISNCLAITEFYVPKQKKYSDGVKLFPDWMGVKDRRLMWIRRPRRANVVVASDGSGDCQTINQALRRVGRRRTRRGRFVIKIKAGIYRENVEIPRSKPNIMLIGDGMNSTLITGSRNFFDGFSTFNSATLTVVGDRFLARDLSVENTAGPWKHQAVATRVTANAAFYRCSFTSYQDSLYVHSLRQFYRDCTIIGTVDFIFGNAAAVFQNCLILVRATPVPGQRAVVTAQGREDPNQNTGISLHNCSIVGANGIGGLGETYLGRPWRNYSRTMVMESYLGEIIHPQGWCRWNEYTTVDTVEYVEFRNEGPGSNTTGRVMWPGYQYNCTETVARRFTVGAFFHDDAAHRWLESTGIPLLDSPL